MRLEGLDSHLPATELTSRLAYAINNRRVEWLPQTPEQYPIFRYYGYCYAVKEYGELLIRAIERVGKMDVDDDGNDVYVDMSNASRVKKNPTWGGW